MGGTGGDEHANHLFVFVLNKENLISFLFSRAWGREAEPHYPGAEPGSRNGAPPVADEADEYIYWYAHVQGLHAELKSYILDV